MHQIDNANAAHETAFRTAVLPACEFDEVRVAFVLHTVVGDQKGIGAIGNQPLNEFPEVPRR
jgi:hypothetical protein